MNHSRSSEESVFWADRRFLTCVIALSLALPLIHIWFMRNDPAFAVPVIDSYDYVRDAEAMLAARDHAPYYHSPFYVWFIALIFFVFGHKLLVVRLIQILVSGLTCLLIYSLGDRLFNKGAARIATIMWCVYGPIIFYAGEVLNATWTVFLDVLSLVLVIRAYDRASASAWLAAGLATGLAAMARPDILPFAALVLIATLVLALRRVLARTKALIGAVAFAMGAGAVLFTVGLRNYQTAGHFLILPANGALSFYYGNNPDYHSTIGIRLGSWYKLADMPLADESDAEKVLPGHGRYYYRKALEFIRRNPFSYLGCLLYKARTLMSGYELPETFDLYRCRKKSPVMYLLVWQAGGFGFPYGLLLPLAVLGGFLSFRRIKTHWWLWVLQSTMLISLIVYCNGSRYRLSFVTILMLFASEALLWLWRKYRKRQSRAMLIGLASVLLVAVITNLPVAHFSHSYNFEAEAYALAGQQLVNEHETEKGLDLLQHSIEVDPGSFDNHFRFGRGLADSGDLDRALWHLNRATEINPDLYRAYNDMGSVFVRKGEFDEAVTSFTKALKINANFYPAYSNIAELLAQKGELDTAIQYYSRTLEINPLEGSAYNGLGVIMARRGSVDQAIIYFSRALGTDSNSALFRKNLEEALQMQNERDP